MWLGIAWLFQDVLQVFLSQNIQAPEYFLLLLLYRTLSREDFGKSSIWIAFLGGFIWDLRWTGLIGMSSGLYIAVVLILNWLWHLFPITGKTPIVFSLLIWSGAFSVYVSRVFVWDIRGLAFSSGFAVQQLCIIPVVIFMGVYFHWKATSQNG